MGPVELTGTGLAVTDVVAVARDGAAVCLGDAARALMEAGAGAVQRALGASEPAYGVSTGFGSLANIVIPAARREELQRALVRSHAAGMGPPVEREVVRAMMVLRARTLAMGCSGARPVVAERIAALLNAGLTPVVPEHGSLGASGDLAPLAHCALALIGEGEVQLADGRCSSAAAALAAAGIEPLTLVAKEGLALINGTDGMLGMLVLATHDLGGCCAAPTSPRAMAVEALLGTDRAFAADLVALRPQPGQQLAAANLRALLAGSEIVASHRLGDDRVQDAYSLRCAPQVTGAARDVLAYADGVADAELRSAIDNPMVLPDGRVESCGNFHGAPLAFACDVLAIAVAEVGAIAERRTDRLLDATRSSGLPPFLGARRRRELGPHDRPVHAGGDGRREPPAGGARRASGRCRRAPCRRTTSRWAGRPRASCASRWRTSRGSSRSSSSARRAASSCARRCAPPRARAALRAVRAAGVPGAGPDRWLAPELAAAERLVNGDALLVAVQAPPGSSCELRRRAPRALPRGTELSCRGWPQEAALRMLMNNLDPDVAERPDDLVVYGGTGRAARSWEAFDAIVRTLRTLAGDETLLVQSGKPVGVFRTHEWAPRVLIANSNLVPDWATWDEFRRLEALGLTMYGQMTAGSWIYIGTPGHRAGDVRVLRGDRAAPLRRLAGRDDHADRRPRRHGRRAAAGGDDERRRRAVHRGRSRAHRAPAARRATSTRSPTRSRTRSPRAAAARDARRAVSDRAVRQRRRRRSRACCGRASPPTSSPTRPAPTTRSSATSPTA